MIWLYLALPLLVYSRKLKFDSTASIGSIHASDGLPVTRFKIAIWYEGTCAPSEFLPPFKINQAPSQPFKFDVIVRHRTMDEDIPYEVEEEAALPFAGSITATDITNKGAIVQVNIEMSEFGDTAAVLPWEHCCTARMSLSLDLDVWSERAELLDTTWYWLECSPDQQKPHCSLVSLGNPQPITLCIVEPGSGYVVQGSPEEIEYSYTLSASAICSASSAWSAAPLQLVRPSQSQEALRLDFILEPPTQSLDYWRVSESSGSDQVDFLNEQRSRDQEGVLMTVSDMRLYVRSPQPHAYMWSQCCDAYTTFSYYVLAISGAITIKDSKTEIFCVGHARGPSEEDCPPDWQEVLHVKPYTLCQDEIHMTMA